MCVCTCFNNKEMRDGLRPLHRERDYIKELWLYNWLKQTKHSFIRKNSTPTGQRGGRSAAKFQQPAEDLVQMGIYCFTTEAFDSSKICQSFRLKDIGWESSTFILRSASPMKRSGSERLKHILFVCSPGL